MKYPTALILCCLQLVSYSQTVKEDSLTISKKGYFRIIYPQVTVAEIKEDIQKMVFILDSTERVRAISVFYDKNKTNKALFLDSDQQLYNRVFDLRNKADSILFHQEFENLQTPKYPRIESRGYNDWRIDTKLQYNISSIAITQDSTSFSYTRNYKDNSEGSAIPVKLLNSFEDLKKNIKQQIKKIDVRDSIVILEAVVSKKMGAKFESIRVLLGERSTFSDAVENSLVNFATWSPALIRSSGRPIRVKMRIYIRLHENGEVELEIPKRLYNHTGD